jgi:hypothetical protein
MSTAHVDFTTMSESLGRYIVTYRPTVKAWPSTVTVAVPWKQTRPTSSPHASNATSGTSASSRIRP